MLLSGYTIKCNHINQDAYVRMGFYSFAGYGISDMDCKGQEQEIMNGKCRQILYFYITITIKKYDYSI